MAGFWDELRSITEAEAQRGNETFARGANIVNMLNQTTESGLGRAMDYENMAQSGLLSMANLAENSRQFDTGHKNAIYLADLKHKLDMIKLEAEGEQEMKVLDKDIAHRSEKTVAEQVLEELQFLKSILYPMQYNSQAGGLPQYKQIYKNEDK